jgi:hypothetical protein
LSANPNPNNTGVRGEHVFASSNATVVTDEARAYLPIVAGYFAGGHQSVNHSKGQYVVCVQWKPSAIVGLCVETSVSII